MKSFEDWLARKPAGPKPRKRIARNVRPKPVSKKRRTTGAEYSSKRKEYLAARPVCLVALPCCDGRSCDVHHKAGRTGTNYLDEATWVATCRTCHDWIHGHPGQARGLGLLV